MLYNVDEQCVLVSYQSWMVPASNIYYPIVFSIRACFWNAISVLFGIRAVFHSFVWPANCSADVGSIIQAFVDSSSYASFPFVEGDFMPVARFSAEQMFNFLRVTKILIAIGPVSFLPLFQGAVLWCLTDAFTSITNTSLSPSFIRNCWRPVIIVPTQILAVLLL